MTFCKFKINILHNEISIFIHDKDILKTLMFFKDNPSFNMHTLIDFTAVDYPNEEKRFELVYLLLSVENNIRIKISIKFETNEKIPSIVKIFPSANWMEREIFDMYGIKFICCFH